MLKRRQPGKRRGMRVVAANVDQVVVVGATRDPVWDQRLMDRFVVVAEANDLSVTVVVNKVDLVEDASPFATPFREAGYAVVMTSVPRRIGLDLLAECLRNRVALGTGATGVGTLG
jgi:ribosome biogenesis GTPase